MRTHVFRYHSISAPKGYALCLPFDSTYEGVMPVPSVKHLGYVAIDNIISCHDCGEPAVYIGRISYDMGWQKCYCANCAYVMEDFVQEEAT